MSLCHLRAQILGLWDAEREDRVGGAASTSQGERTDPERVQAHPGTHSKLLASTWVLLLRACTWRSRQREPLGPAGLSRCLRKHTPFRVLPIFCFVVVKASLRCNSHATQATHLKRTIQGLVCSHSCAAISTDGFRTFPSSPKESNN